MTPAASRCSTADVVFVHGFAADRLSWLATTAAVDAGRTLVVDLPGHGRCEHPARTLPALVDWLVELLGQRVAAPAHVVGHSLGGGLALCAAARCPALFKSLFLLAPAGLGRAVSNDFLTRYPAVTTQPDMQALLLELVARPSLVGRQTVRYALAQLDRAGRREALAGIAAAVLGDEDDMTAAARDVARTDLPRQVIWGCEDTINPFDAQALAAFGSNTLLHKTGHLPHVESAGAVNTALAAFIRAADAGVATP